MLKAFFSSATGMRAQELLIDNTANNLANVNTSGFKARRMNFADLIYDSINRPGATAGNGQARPIGLEIGSGVRTVGTTAIYSQGTPQETEIATHITIEGDGFFRVTRGNQIAFTRDGSFTRNNQGQLTNSDGFLLDPPVTIPPNASSISISPQGQLSFLVDGVPTDGGQITISRFPNPEGLRSLGGNLLEETEASGAELPGNPAEDGFGSLRQGAVEGSNVEVVSELVSLITAQRAYEINSRAIRAGDEMLSTAAEIVR